MFDARIYKNIKMTYSYRYTVRTSNVQTKKKRGGQCPHDPKENGGGDTKPINLNKN